ncbi:MAG TPA: cell division protein CrgA [Actinomycetota bacterium]
MPKSRQRQRSKRRSYVAPPPKRKPKDSPPWFGWLILGVMGLGVLTIVFNYMNLVPGGTNQGYLWGGLALIAVGFGLATRLR